MSNRAFQTDPPGTIDSAGGHHRADRSHGKVDVERPAPASHRVAVPVHQRLHAIAAAAIVGGPPGYLVAGLLRHTSHESDGYPIDLVLPPGGEAALHESRAELGHTFTL